MVVMMKLLIISRIIISEHLNTHYLKEIISTFCSSEFPEYAFKICKVDGRMHQTKNEKFRVPFCIYEQITLVTSSGIFSLLHLAHHSAFSSLAGPAAMKNIYYVCTRKQFKNSHRTSSWSPFDCFGTPTWRP